MGYIDIHSHILPGADDGPKTMEEALDIIRLASEQGIIHMIATPHYHQGVYGRPPAELVAKITELRTAVKEAGIAVRLSLGNEIYYSGGVLEKLEAKRIFTLGKSGYVLVEFSPAEEFRRISEAMHGLLLGGYKPILAHAERYRCLREDLGKLRELVRMGVYIQINTSSIAGEEGFFMRRFTDRLMREDLIHFVATDSHSARSRSPKAKACVKRIEKRYGTDYVNTLFFDNPRKVLNNEFI